MLGDVQTNLDSQIAYFNVIPDYTVHLDDAASSLRLMCKTQGTGMKDNVKILAVEYKIYYKLMKTGVAPDTRLKNNPGKTTLLQSHSRNHTYTPKAITWKDIEFPEEWKFTGKRKVEESSEITNIYEDNRGGISIMFAKAKLFEERETFGDTESDLDEDNRIKENLKVIKNESLEELENEFYNTDDVERMNYCIKKIQELELENLKAVGKEEDVQMEENDYPKVTYVSNPTTVIKEGKTPDLRTGSLPTGRRTEPNTITFTPKRNDWGVPIHSRGVWLDIDCVADRTKTIHDWVQAVNLASAHQGMDAQTSQHYFEFTLRGITKEWFEHFKLSQDYINWKETIKNDGNAISFAQPFYQNFCGHDGKSGVIRCEIAKQHLAGISLCDLSYFDEYTCEYEKHYYTLKPIGAEDEIYKQMYIQKLPEPWNQQIWENIRTKPLDYHTLGGHIQRAKEFIRDVCIKNHLAKQAKKQMKGTESSYPMGM